MNASYNGKRLFSEMEGLFVSKKGFKSIDLCDTREYDLLPFQFSKSLTQQADTFLGAGQMRSILNYASGILGRILIQKLCLQPVQTIDLVC